MAAQQHSGRAVSTAAAQRGADILLQKCIDLQLPPLLPLCSPALHAWSLKCRALPSSSHSTSLPQSPWRAASSWAACPCSTECGCRCAVRASQTPPITWRRLPPAARPPYPRCGVCLPLPRPLRHPPTQTPTRSLAFTLFSPPLQGTVFQTVAGAVTLDDGTGTVEVSLGLARAGPGLEIGTVQLGSYVLVIGRLVARKQGGGTHLSIRPKKVGAACGGSLGQRRAACVPLTGMECRHASSFPFSPPP